jgi:hypothetical protein
LIAQIVITSPPVASQQPAALLRGDVASSTAVACPLHRCSWREPKVDGGLTACRHGRSGSWLRLRAPIVVGVIGGAERRPCSAPLCSSRCCTWRSAKTSTWTLGHSLPASVRRSPGQPRPPASHPGARPIGAATVAGSRRLRGVPGSGISGLSPTSRIVVAFVIISGCLRHAAWAQHANACARGTRVRRERFEGSCSRCDASSTYRSGERSPAGQSA